MKLSKLDCKGCSHCCKYMTFGINWDGWRPDEKRRKVEFYKARGCVLFTSKDKLVIVIPQRCPHIIEDGACGIYGNRPEGCRDYDCRLDEYLPPGGNYE